ncbi:FAD-binding protein [Glutamicibacter mysorens]|nr:FAD-binding protein [Glutamicibacter mysorens]UTM48876.1 FAD-binding protein [Glutamicibacter mysorens]
MQRGCRYRNRRPVRTWRVSLRRYYGDPTQQSNPNLRALDGKAYYAVKIVLSDLGTCGGVMTDAHGRALDTSGEVIEGLYAQGNTAANIFGNVYPGAGATIGQGLVFGTIIATHAAQKARDLVASA